MPLVLVKLVMSFFIIDTRLLDENINYFTCLSLSNFHTIDLPLSLVLINHKRGSQSLNKIEVIDDMANKKMERNLTLITYSYSELEIMEVNYL